MGVALGTSTTPMTPTLEAAVAPLDSARRSGLQLLSRSRHLTRVMATRETRIAALGSAQVLVLFALTMRWPVAMYFLGPVAFGVVHLAADLRYLVLRLPLPRELLIVSAVLAVALTLVRVCLVVGVAGSALCARIDIVLGLAWVGFALARRFRDARLQVALAAPVFLVLAGLMVQHAERVDLALTHAHNLFAFVLWFALFRRRPGWAALPVVLALLASVFLLSGVTLAWTSQQGGLFAFGQGVARFAHAFAPSIARRAAVGVAVAFIFLQSVHYAVWTAWVPQDCLPGQGTFTFRMTVRSLLADFGPVLLAIVAVAALALVVAAAFAIKPAVAWYMTFARAHVWFELAVFATVAFRREAA